LGKRIKFGPGFLITAAFVGPGTVTSASFAGANFGFSLLWVVVVSGFLAFVLQEMSGRFSLEYGKDLSASLLSLTPFRFLNLIFAFLAVSAVVLGAVAYEAGNITGAFVGLDALIPAGKLWVLIITGVALFFLWRGRYRPIEVFLMGLVGFMGLAFLLTALKAGPPLWRILLGLLPIFPHGGTSLALALLGTTVVPYNLFLYSAVVLKRWGPEDLQSMRWDLGLSIFVGIIITASILITSASAFVPLGIKIKSASVMARQLRPLLGRFATASFCLGLFAAGLSSAITAPYASAWLLKGIFGFKENSLAFKSTASGVVIFGFLSLFLKIKPLQLIVLAQIANGLILPLVVFFLGMSVLRKNSGPGRILLFLLSFSLVLIIVMARFI